MVTFETEFHMFEIKVCLFFFSRTACNTKVKVTNLSYYLPYTTLHSNNLIWVVCLLFSRQRWRTHTNIQSRETIGQENHMTRLKLRPRKFRPAFFEADSKTGIFYKYVVFKHSVFFFSNFHCSADTLSPV